jgi:hypothetical protein
MKTFVHDWSIEKKGIASDYIFFRLKMSLWFWNTPFPSKYYSQGKKCILVPPTLYFSWSEINIVVGVYIFLYFVIYWWFTCMSCIFDMTYFCDLSHCAMYLLYIYYIGLHNYRRNLSLHMLYFYCKGYILIIKS